MLQIRLTNLSTNVGIYMLPAKVIVCQVCMFYQCGISFQPVVVIALGNDLLFNSILGHCGKIAQIYYYDP
jgi:hypothetical protein